MTTLDRVDLSLKGAAGFAYLFLAAAGVSGAGSALQWTAAGAGALFGVFLGMRAGRKRRRISANA